MYVCMYVKRKTHIISYVFIFKLYNFYFYFLPGVPPGELCATSTCTHVYMCVHSLVLELYPVKHLLPSFLGVQYAFISDTVSDTDTCI